MNTRSALLPKRWVAAGLFVSLCLNGVLVGYLVTRSLERMKAPAVVAGPQRLMEMVASRLPKQDAEILWRVFRQHEGEIRSAQRAYQATLAAAAQVLAQPSPASDQLQLTIRDARDKRVAVGDLAIAVFMDALPQMSLAGRQQLIGTLRR